MIASNTPPFTQSEEIRLGLLMAVESVLNETKEFERLRTKLKNRRLDHDANYNKLQKSSGKDVQLEEKVQTTNFKYQETLKKLEELMIGVARQEIALIDPMIEFLENQVNFHQKCLKASQETLKALNEGKEGLKGIDYSTMSFRKEFERDDFEEVELELGSEEVEVLDSHSQVESITSSFVPLSLPSTATEPIRTVKAKYAFVAENENEMSLSKGDVIKVLKEVDEGWWLGECDGRKGLFPSNYVAELEQEQEKAKESASVTKEEFKQDDLTASEPKQPVQPGFSYLPPGAPITFIGRKKREAEAAAEEGNTSIEAPVACSECDCDDFCANVFKPGHCNNCFHKH